MFKIGEFARFSRVSVKMLRRYDDLGLLRPHAVDPFTGYRYYTADQLPRLNRILALRDLGLSLAQIGQVLNDRLTAAELRGMLRFKEAELAQQIAEQQRRLDRVAERLQQIEAEEVHPPYEVIVRPVAAEAVAWKRRQVRPEGDELQHLFEDVETYVARHRARAPRPPLLIQYDWDRPGARRDVAVAIPVLEPVPDGAGIRYARLPEVPAMACLVHTGSYDSLGQAHQTLRQWLPRHAYRLAGPARTVYLRFGADAEQFTVPAAYLAIDAAQFVTEIQAPVTRASD